MLRPRVVLDTSVLLSAERDELLFLARDGLYTMLCSPFLLGEVVRIRTEKAIEHGQARELYRARINAYISRISGLAIMVDHTLLIGGNYTEWLRDPDDEPLLATALVGGAQYIVSWNIWDFPPRGSYAGIKYLTPPQFFAELYSALQVVDESLEDE